MVLTMNGIMEYLSTRYKIEKTGGFSSDFPINGVSLNHIQCDANDILYLCLEKPSKPKDNCLYIVTDTISCKQPGWYLYCEKGKLWNAINDCFLAYQEFQQWREKCRELALIEHDLTALLELGGRFLRSEMVIIDRDYRYDGSTRQNNPEGGFFSSTEDMDARAVEELYIANPQFDETFQTDGLVFYPYHAIPSTNLYYYNLRYERLYLGRLLYSMPTELDGTGLRYLAEEFGALVAKCYEFHYLRKNKGMPRYSMYDIWKQMLENKPLDRDLAMEKLQSMEWKVDDRYRIYFLLSNGYSRSDETLKFYAAQVEQSFPACIAAQLEDGIYMIHNLDKEENSDFRQQLADFLRENLFLSGISNGFQDFFDSYRYGCQAKEALQLGLRKNPSLWRHEFRDYQTEYIAQQCLARYKARDLCPYGLEKLLQHDEQNPEGELVRTLEVYFQCRFNAAEAAKQLFIHRTTLFYRLNKIKQIAQIAFESSDENLSYQLSLALLRQEQELKNK